MMDDKRIVVQLSGGKDSIAALHMALQVSTQVTAIYNDMGDSYPHVVEYIHNVCATWDVPLVISKPDKGVLEEGVIPADVVPVWASDECRDTFAGVNHRPKAVFRSGIACCSKHLFVPLMQATLALKPDEIWRGSKAADAHVTANDITINGIPVKCPVWDMTDDEVMRYLADHGIELPAHYSMGVNHSLDCKSCTAWLSEPCELDRIAFNAKYYPVAHELFMRRKQLILDEVNLETNWLAALGGDDDAI